MARRSYQEALADLRAAVIGMGDLVVDRLSDGLRALTTGDDALARSVVEGDDVVNDRYLKIESDCIDLLALQQPVASDLRLVTAAFKIITDLERIADIAANLGRYALAADGGFDFGVSIGDLGQEARSLVKQSLQGFADEDKAACRALVEANEQLDAACLAASETIARSLIEDGVEDPWDVERVLDDVSRLLLTVRDLERIGDHAVNIAARTVYMIDHDPALIR